MVRPSPTASSDPFAQGCLFPRSCGTVISPEPVIGPEHAEMFRCLFVSGELGVWLGGLAQLIAAGYSSAALQSPSSEEAS